MPGGNAFSDYLSGPLPNVQEVSRVDNQADMADVSANSEQKHSTRLEGASVDARLTLELVRDPSRLLAVHEIVDQLLVGRRIVVGDFNALTAVQFDQQPVAVVFIRTTTTIGEFYPEQVGIVNHARR